MFSLLSNQTTDHWVTVLFSAISRTRAVRYLLSGQETQDFLQKKVNSAPEKISLCACSLPAQSPNSNGRQSLSRLGALQTFVCIRITCRVCKNISWPHPIFRVADSLRMGQSQRICPYSKFPGDAKDHILRSTHIHSTFKSAFLKPLLKI